MKSIIEKFTETQDIASYLSSRLDEGFFSKARETADDIKRAFNNIRDKFNWVKEKFRNAWIYGKNVVVKFKNYFLAVDDDGNIIPAITPLTMDDAYVEGLIDKATTCVLGSMASSKITGNKADWDDARALYGSGDSRSYWSSIYNESKIDNDSNLVNEVKLHTEDPQAKYNIIVDNKRLRDTIIRHIENPKLAKLLIMGAPGIGKTAILDAVADALRKVNPSKYGDFKVVTKVLSNETPDNFFLPDYAEIKIDGEVVDRKATDVPKTWLPVYKPTGDPKKDSILDQACGHGMLFVDELSRATPQVLNVILPLINEGRLNEYKMGSGWTVVAASNRAEDEMSGQSNIGNALANRFSIVYYEPTVNTWMEWAKTQGFISPLLLQWLSLPESEQMSGGKFYYWDPNESDAQAGADSKIMCTPRSWTNAMRELAVFANTADMEGFKLLDIPFEDIGFIFNQYIPSAAIDTFFSFLSVIKSIGNVEKVAESIWKTGKAPKINQKTLMQVSLPLAQLIITSHGHSLPTEEEFTNLANWVASEGTDQLATYILDNFKNVFVGTLVEQGKTKAVDNVFLVGYNIKNNPEFQKGTASYDLWEGVMKPFLDTWKLSSLDEVPNYYPGIEIMANKFGKIMAEYKIDDKMGLD